MTDEDRQDRLMQLFAEGAELDGEARRAFVEHSTADDPELRRELVELLDVAAQRLDGFMTRPAVAPGSTPVGSLVDGPPRITGFSGFAAIGEGGMGTVYRARQEHPVRRMVAVKTLRAGASSRDAQLRFAAEREALARMAHPNIATVYDAGTDELGRPYLVMEFVPGTPITEHCELRAVGLEQRLELFAAVCDAVEHAHRRGVLHRDLKPSNILVTESDGQPRPKVIDFGIAKGLGGALTDQTAQTMQGALLGTLEYMSPEQLESDRRAVDTRSDIYALGVVLYELLVGDRPFDSTRFQSAGLTELLRIVRDETPPKPSTRLRQRTAQGHTTTQWLGRIGGELDWVVMKALEKDPDRRYQTPRELADDVRRFLAHEPVEAGPPSGLYRLRKFARRHRGLVASTTLALTLLVGGLIAVSILAARNDALAHRETLARTEAEANSRRLRESLYRSQMRLGTEALESPGGVARARAAIEPWRPAPGVSDLRGFEWHLLAAETRREARVVEAEPLPISLTWDDDGHLVSAHWHRAIQWPGKGGERQTQWESPVRPVAAWAASRDGRILAMSVTPTDIELRDRASGRALATFSEPVTLSARFADPRSSQALRAAERPQRHSERLYLGFLHSLSEAVKECRIQPLRILLRPLRGLGERVRDVVRQTSRFRHTLSHPGPVYRAEISADGGVLICQYAHKGAVVWDTVTGQQLAHIVESMPGPVAVTPDGSMFAHAVRVGTGDVQVRVRRRDAPGEVYRELRGRPAISSWAIAFDDKGELVASADDRGMLRIWDVASGEIVLETEHGDGLRCVAFEPGGTRVAVGSQDYAIYVHDLRTAASRRLSGHTNVVNALAWNREGAELVSLGDDGTLRWWSLDAHEARRTMPRPLHSHPVYAQITFDEAGEQLAMHAQHIRSWTWNLAADTTRAGYLLGRSSGRVRTDGDSNPAVGALPSFRFAAVRPTDRTIALVTGRSGSVWLWAEGAESPIAHPAPTDVRGLAWIADGRLALIDGTDHLRIHDGAFEHELVACAVPGAALALAASPIEDVLAVGCADQAVRLFSAGGQELAALRGHTGHVQAVAFSPDGTRLASGSRDGTVRLWDVAARAEVASLRAPGKVIAVAFSADGMRLAALADDGCAALWDARGR